jgi:hypothetical protein
MPPYGDPVEIVTAPIPAQSPFIPADAKIVVGAVAPASPDPIPIVLQPGFEYRMLEWRHPDTHEVHWRLQRRKSAQHGDDEVASPNAERQLLTGAVPAPAAEAGARVQVRTQSGINAAL